MDTKDRDTPSPKPEWKAPWEKPFTWSAPDEKPADPVVAEKPVEKPKPKAHPKAQPKPKAKKPAATSDADQSDAPDASDTTEQRDARDWDSPRSKEAEDAIRSKAEELSREHPELGDNIARPDIARAMSMSDAKVHLANPDKNPNDVMMSGDPPADYTESGERLGDRIQNTKQDERDDELLGAQDRRAARDRRGVDRDALVTPPEKE